ncbi:MAG: hypothetical protein R6U96_14300 [Promethearchaeia archaeon]
MPEKENRDNTGASFLERALKSAKKTKTALKGILEKESEEGQFYKRDTKQEEEVKTPHLYYESKEEDTEMQEDYQYEAKEESVPVEGELSTIKEKPSFVKEEEKSPAPTVEETQIPSSPPPTEQSYESGRLELYRNLTTFFENYLKSYKNRYERWENSISNILSILRKMRKITKKNTEELVETINNLYDKILKGIDQFKVKRREVERIADVNLDEMGAEFKKVLGLLSLQIKEYQMKRMTDELLPLLELQ